MPQELIDALGLSPNEVKTVEVLAWLSAQSFQVAVWNN